MMSLIEHKHISMRHILLFFVGFMTMTHLIILFPYIYYAITIVIIFTVWIIFESPWLRGIISRAEGVYLAWYGLFVAMVFFSLLYTVNTLNPGYVILRVGVIFPLGLMTVSLVQSERDFESLANGFIFSSIGISILTIANEGIRLGVNRIGRTTVGSSVALSGILLVAVICAYWRTIFHRKNRALYLVIAVFLEMMIFLTGSRRAIMLSMLFILLLFFLNNTIKKSRKTLLLLIALILIVTAIYLMLTNEQLYKLVGWRFDSMLSAFAQGSGSGDDASLLERGIMKQYAMKLFEQKPFFGYGVHGFAYEFYYFYGKLLYSHSGFTEILACYGLSGAVIFYQIFVRFALNYRYLFQYQYSYQMLLVLYALITLLSEGYTIAFITPQVVVMLAAAISVVVPKYKYQSKESGAPLQ